MTNFLGVKCQSFFCWFSYLKTKIKCLKCIQEVLVVCNCEHVFVSWTRHFLDNVLDFYLYSAIKSLTYNVRFILNLAWRKMTVKVTLLVQGLGCSQLRLEGFLLTSTHTYFKSLKAIRISFICLVTFISFHSDVMSGLKDSKQSEFVELLYYKISMLTFQEGRMGINAQVERRVFERFMLHNCHTRGNGREEKAPSLETTSSPLRFPIDVWTDEKLFSLSSIWCQTHRTKHFSKWIPSLCVHLQQREAISAVKANFNVLVLKGF